MGRAAVSRNVTSPRRLSASVHRDVAHRARAVEGDERDAVLELGRLHEPQRLTHPGGLELEDASGLAARQHLVRLRVVERDLRDVDSADEPDRLVDDVEVAQAEEVHLQEAERLDVLHRELGTTLWLGALLLERHVLGQRTVADDDARGVDRVLADEALERSGEVDTWRTTSSPSYA